MESQLLHLWPWLPPGFRDADIDPTLPSPPLLTAYYLAPAGLQPRTEHLALSSNTTIGVLWKWQLQPDPRNGAPDTAATTTAASRPDWGRSNHMLHAQVGVRLSEPESKWWAKEGRWGEQMGERGASNGRGQGEDAGDRQAAGESGCSTLSVPDPHPSNLPYHLTYLPATTFPTNLILNY